VWDKAAEGDALKSLIWKATQGLPTNNRSEKFQSEKPQAVAARPTFASDAG